MIFFKKDKKELENGGSEKEPSFFSFQSNVFKVKNEKEIKELLSNKENPIVVFVPDSEVLSSARSYAKSLMNSSYVIVYSNFCPKEINILLKELENIAFSPVFKPLSGCISFNNEESVKSFISHLTLSTSKACITILKGVL